MSEYLFDGKLRSPDELMAIATYRAKEIAYLKADLKETVSLKYHDDLMHDWKVSEVAKDKRIAELESALRDFPTIASGNAALIKRIKMWLPRRRAALAATEQEVSDE